MAFGHLLVLGSTALGLGALRGEEVTEAGRATHELTFGGKLEALGDGLLGLLHGWEGEKAETRAVLGKGKSGRWLLRFTLWLPR